MKKIIILVTVSTLLLLGTFAASDSKTTKPTPVSPTMHDPGGGGA